MCLRSISAVVLLGWVAMPLGADETVRQVPSDISHEQFIRSIAFSPDGLFLAVGGGGQHAIGNLLGEQKLELTVWDVKTRKRVVTLVGHTKTIAAVAFSPDGKTLASASYDGTIRLWDVVTWKALAVLKDATGVVLHLAFSPDGKTLAGSVGSKLDRDTLLDMTVPGSIFLWDTPTRTVRAKLKGHAGPIMCMAFNPDGKVLASGSGRWDKESYSFGAGEVRLWNPAKGELVRTLTVKESVVTALSFTPDGKTLATGDARFLAVNNTSHGGRVRYWDSTMWKEEPTSASFDATGVAGLKFSPDGKRLVMASGMKLQRLPGLFSGLVDSVGETILLDARSLKPVSTLPDSKGYEGLVAFSPEGDLLATGQFWSVQLWSVTKAK